MTCLTARMRSGLILLLVASLVWSPAAVYAAPGTSDDDDLIESDDDDLLLEEDEAEAVAAVKTILLDINPVGAPEDVTDHVYRAVLTTLHDAEDLGEIISRDQLGRDKLTRHVINSCRGIDNTKCLQSFALAAEARYAIYGELRDLDDTFMVYLEMLDVKTGRVLESVRSQVTSLNGNLAEKASEAACRLTRFYGCNRQEAASVPAAVVTPATAPNKTQPDGESDETELFKDDTPVEPEDKMSGMEIGGWVMIGLAGASLIGAGTTTALMYMAYGDYQDANEGQKARDKKDEALLYQWTSIGLYGATAAFAAAGTAMLLLSKANEEEGSGGGLIVAPTTQPDGAGLVIMGRF